MEARSLAGDGSYWGIKTVGVVVAGLIVGMMLVLLVAGKKPADTQVGNDSSQTPEGPGQGLHDPPRARPGDGSDLRDIR